MMGEKLDALRGLLAKLETGETYATMGHTLLCQKAFPKPADFDGTPEAYASSNAQQAILAWRNGDLNAAMALHEAVLPEWHPLLGRNVHHHHCTARVQKVWWGEVIGHSCGSDQPTLARAWLAAILKALIAEAEAAA